MPQAIGQVGTHPELARADAVHQLARAPAEGPERCVSAQGTDATWYS
jgi:hypothetical protein